MYLTRTVCVGKPSDKMKSVYEEEAILQMDLLGHDFFIFKNISTDNVAVVYRRKDGDYGIIEMI